MAKIYNDITETIGNTPLVRLNKVTQGIPATILLKCEFFNPLASVKDRIGLAMIEAAERDGKINKDSVIIEPTSGNTGIALAFVCASKGYRLILTMPETMSLERRYLLKMLGAELVLTPGAKGMKGAIAKAEELKSRPQLLMPQQFENPSPTRDPPPHHRRGNLARHRRQESTSSSPASAPAAPSPASPKCSSSATRLQGHRRRTRRLPRHQRRRPGPTRSRASAPASSPRTLNTGIVDEVVKITNDEAFSMARRLAKEEGIFGGISTGANVTAAIKVASRPENKGKTIVTIACSFGERYLSTALADEARSVEDAVAVALS
jgi:cysteine synthase A